MKKAIYLTIISLLLLGCQQGVVFTEFKSLPSKGWQADSVVVFSPSMTDSVAEYSLYIALRHTDRYAYQNLWMFVDIRQDSVLLRRDTIEAILANERGGWIGNGISKYTMSLPYLEHVQVHEGAYEVVVQQGMREEALRGLTDIGLEIIKN